MALRWNRGQTEIYDLIQAGASSRDIEEKGYTWDLIKKVKKAINKGDAPKEAMNKSNLPLEKVLLKLELELGSRRPVFMEIYPPPAGKIRVWFEEE